MLTKLSVRNFRNLDCVTLDPLGRITLIAGKNGAGKTALLEALFLFTGPDNPELGIRVDSMRGFTALQRDYMFRNVFRDFDTDRRIEIVGHGDWGSRPRKLEVYLQDHNSAAAFRPDTALSGSAGLMSISSSEGDSELVFSYKHDDGEEYTSRAWWVAENLIQGGPVPTLTQEGIRQERQVVHHRPASIFMPALHRDDPQISARRMGKLQLSGDDDKIIDIIRLLEPRLEGLTSISIEDTPIIHAYLSGMTIPIPIYLLGEGLNRMFRLGLAMNEARGGMLLVDEIENGLHYSTHKEIFSILHSLAGTFGVQIVATTHSGECIRAAHRSLSHKGKREFAFHRLDRRDDGVTAARFKDYMLDTAIELNLEIR